MADNSRLPPRPYDMFMLALCLYALAAMAALTLLPEEAPARTVLEVADLGVCLLFFGDFVVSLARAPNRRRYFLTWGWIDLLSSIPAVDILRVGRLARVLRILRVFRGVRATRVLSGFVIGRRANGAFLAAALITFLLVVFASLAVLQFERAEGGNIKAPEDALWWAVATITTVGYGDRYPVSTEGRILAATLMTAALDSLEFSQGLLPPGFSLPRPQQVRANSS